MIDSNGGIFFNEGSSSLGLLKFPPKSKRLQLLRHSTSHGNHHIGSMLQQLQRFYWLCENQKGVGSKINDKHYNTSACPMDFLYGFFPHVYSFIVFMIKYWMYLTGSFALFDYCHWFKFCENSSDYSYLPFFIILFYLIGCLRKIHFQ
jgi:hypothetical protein